VSVSSNAGVRPAKFGYRLKGEDARPAAKSWQLCSDPRVAVQCRYRAGSCHQNKSARTVGCGRLATILADQEMAVFYYGRRSGAPKTARAISPNGAA
jgi:hypothetical protein